MRIDEICERLRRGHRLTCEVRADSAEYRRSDSCWRCRRHGGSGKAPHRNHRRAAVHSTDSGDRVPVSSSEPADTSNDACRCRQKLRSDSRSYTSTRGKCSRSQAQSTSRLTSNRSDAVGANRAAGFGLIGHYYRPPHRPRAEQPWLATVWQAV